MQAGTLIELYEYLNMLQIYKLFFNQIQVLLCLTALFFTKCLNLIVIC